VIVAGLTGGIATGKSTVSSVFKDCGAVVIDADRIARDVVAKDRHAWRQIVAHFGKRVLQADGQIDRRLLAEIIFTEARQKQHLDRIVHPHVIVETNRQLKQARRQQPRAIVILDVPLLFEAGMNQGLDEVIVVYVPEQIQLHRLMRRDRLTKDQALSRIRSQMPIEEKKRLATIVIDNSNNRAVTNHRTRQVYGDLKKKLLREQSI
jgi:dephospho-CoA kinase